MIEKVRKAMTDLEARGINPTVRAVRLEIDGGSYTDVGEAIRQVKKERDRLNSVRTEMPKDLQDKLNLLSLDFWTSAQEMANRAIEDVRQGCEVRVEAAETQAHETLREIDDAESRIDDLARKLEEKHRDCAILQESEKAALDQATAAEVRVAAMEAEIRVMRDHTSRRERDLEKAYSGIERMTAALAGTQKTKSAPRPTGNGKSAGNTKPADLGG
jgi:chromosome segregation ATPase